MSTLKQKGVPKKKEKNKKMTHDISVDHFNIVGREENNLKRQ